MGIIYIIILLYLKNTNKMMQQLQQSKRSKFITFLYLIYIETLHCPKHHSRKPFRISLISHQFSKFSPFSISVVILPNDGVYPTFIVKGLISFPICPSISLSIMRREGPRWKKSSIPRILLARINEQSKIHKLWYSPLLRSEILRPGNRAATT